MKQRITWILLVLACTLAVTLCACGSPSSSDQSNSSGEANPSVAQPASLQAIHAETAWSTIQADPSKKTCFSCHVRDDIIEATKDYQGVAGLNPHASHTESYDCTKCHSLTGKNVLVCNTACHGGYHGDGSGWPLPDENWQSPTDELPAADGVAIPTNIK